MDVQGNVALGVFWFILLITLIGVFGTLHLEQLSGPFGAMVEQIMTYLSNLLAGLLLLVLAWLAGTLVRALANKALKATQWDEKSTEQAGCSRWARTSAMSCSGW